ncbi:flagellar filament capping protein FliD [Kineococcus radiotolerans]|uniref:Flagellar hook-associated protein 2 n=1 Tax=Kineococcus radiotolerans (strain ATCC BAA-149 / DSM 14245 / SRS30216) TaxID=266940 RepID=A6W8H4_KINRD|nr:flagellar filament capping protein FliD [Kineococcus radiotolerans]ABS03113.1 flagellar hook-associated 2 domain protein [Kineococcus radiotolerans SRS30216 = ATCC BAA-149]
MSTISSSSVDGLVSGLQTSSIISSLIAVDSATQTRLKSSVSSTQLKITAYQSVSSKMLAVQEAATKLQAATAWTPTKATSSDKSVAVSTTEAASAGSVSFSVTGVAAGRTVTSAIFNSKAADKGAELTSALGGSPLDVVRSDGKFVTITPSSGDLEAVAKAVNDAADLGIKAVAIRVGDGQYRLQITSTKTGASEGDFKIVPSVGGNASTGRDGKLREVGFDAQDFADLNVQDVTRTGGTGYTASSSKDASILLATGDPMTSPTNTFSDIIAGLSFTVSAESPFKADAPTEREKATVSVAPNSAAVAASMKALVDAANAALDDVALQSRAASVSADGSVTGGGTLRGDPALRSLRSQIIEAVTGNITATGINTSAASFGVESTRDGKLVFKEGSFLAAYEKDPTGLKDLVAKRSTTVVDGKTVVADDGKDGIATRLRNVVDQAIGRKEDTAIGLKALDGTITQIITNQNISIADLKNRIADWDVKLKDKQAYYQKYYGALEVQLGKLQSQSSWLAGQLSNLGS